MIFILNFIKSFIDLYRFAERALPKQIKEMEENNEI
jgi:hypothetical protein